MTSPTETLVAQNLQDYKGWVCNYYTFEH